MDKLCSECSNSFNSKIANKLTCSAICSAARNQRLKLSKRKQCLKCGNAFITTDNRKKYCNRSCSTSANNIGINRNSGGINGQKVSQKVCPECNNIFHSNTKVFCNSNCKKLNKKKLFFQDWIDGKIGLSNKDGSLKSAAKKFLIAEVGNQCSQCGWNTPNPVLKRPILTIDHIDGNWKNNYKINLRVLCFNCHTLTSTFGALNKGSVSPRSKTTRKLDIHFEA